MAIPVYRPPSPFTAMYWIWMTMHRFSIRWAIPMKFSKISPSAKMLLLWAPPTWIQVRNWILHFFWFDFELKNAVQIQCRCMPILAYRWGLVLFCVEFTYFVDRNHTFDISRFDFTCCTIYYTNIDIVMCANGIMLMILLSEFVVAVAHVAFYLRFALFCFASSFHRLDRNFYVTKWEQHEEEWEKTTKKL